MIGEGKVSIWFFIGSILTVYGLIILVASIYYASIPSTGQKVVLDNLHAGIWWGILLLIIGLSYLIFFRPGRKK